MRSSDYYPIHRQSMLRTKNWIEWSEQIVPLTLTTKPIFHICGALSRNFFAGDQSINLEIIITTLKMIGIMDTLSRKDPLSWRIGGLSITTRNTTPIPSLYHPLL